MLDLRKVAVTGSLSCGKSSVCLILKELGAYVVSADKVVHQLLSSKTNLGQKVIKLLGSDICVNQEIDRSRVAHIVFHNVTLLKALEKLMHPAVYKELELEYQKQKELPQPPSLFVAEIPLLFEIGWDKYYDVTIAVAADPEICCRRFEETTGKGSTEFYSRMARQLPLLTKMELADYVIMNNSTLSDLHQTTKKLYQDLIS